MEKALAKVVDLLTQSNIDRGVQIARLSELVNDGDMRISRVNEMVLKLIDTINSIESKYEMHIERCATARDNLINQNGELIRVVSDLQHALADSNTRYKDLLTQYERLAMRANAGTQVNVK